MNPANDPKLIEWTRKLFNERNIIPIMEFFIEMGYEKIILIELIMNSIENYKKFYSCNNIFIEMSDNMDENYKIDLNERYFECIDTIMIIKQNFRLNNPDLYSE